MRGASQPSFGPHGLTYLTAKGVFAGGKLLVRGSIDGAQWSPNGKRLALTISHGTDDSLVLADKSGHLTRQLAEYGGFVAWSPDGRRMLYEEEPAVNSLFLANGDGSKPIRLSTESNFIAWAPDGRHIAYTAGDPVFGPTLLVIAPADGGKQVIETTNADPGIRFAWSPNGHQLAYTSGTGTDVSLTNADGTHGTLLAAGVETQPYVACLLWSPDGTHLIAGKTLIDVTSGQQVQLPSDAFSTAWYPDGSVLAGGAGNGIALFDADGSQLASVSLCKP
jgi:Tol biopolymer transport system component